MERGEVRHWRVAVPGATRHEGDSALYTPSGSSLNDTGGTVARVSVTTVSWPCVWSAVIVGAQEGTGAAGSPGLPAVSQHIPLGG
ncbi:hypothetical protein AAFF_G00263620 [Aldrovandia affinis]|uniref:Uncharacterized protein n=1 Tax=Aldrovandia affinis TaxID=143900 RepID=A0AAD7WTW8_9TELE|nr:hypothetical protein AAFF_G00263620 [Aldrovandia affinis]